MRKSYSMVGGDWLLAAGAARPLPRLLNGWLADPHYREMLCNFISATVFLFLGMGVYQAWIYCVTGWPKLRWLFLRNQDVPHSHS